MLQKDGVVYRMLHSIHLWRQDVKGLSENPLLTLIQPLLLPAVELEWGFPPSGSLAYLQNK